MPVAGWPQKYGPILQCVEVMSVFLLMSFFSEQKFVHCVR